MEKNNISDEAVKGVFRVVIEHGPPPDQMQQQHGGSPQFERIPSGEMVAPLIDSIIRCMKPDPRALSQFTIYDPACGTGGFLVSAYEWLMGETKKGALDRTVARRVKSKTYFGQDIGETPRRLALMNLVLHGLEPQIKLGDTIYEAPSSDHFDCILTNPPFGKKSTIAIVNEAGQLEKEDASYERQDFWTTTKNKQLNFLQHVKTLLKVNGRCAIVVPDNVLFEGGAGETVRRKLLH